MTDYYRPLAQTGSQRPTGAVRLAGTQSWFTHVEILSRTSARRIVTPDALPGAVMQRLTAPRADVAGLDLSHPRIMGILNVTPDSFSDGGAFDQMDQAIQRALTLRDAGADMIDIGGESTRPGAHEVPAEAEIARTEPVIRALTAQNIPAISIDTRKAVVAEAALEAGAGLVNDVSGFTFDPALAPLCAARQVPVCVMHAQGLPETMQDDPQYENVVLDVYDFLATQIAGLERLGLKRDQIVVDPGIGFGKTMAHNLALLANLSVFHALGCPILLGVSRKGFIGRIGKAEAPKARAAGSIALALDAARQGVQIFRVHDVDETRQAFALWQAATQGKIL